MVLVRLVQSPRSRLGEFDGGRQSGTVDTPVWSIVCFVVGRAARGRGVAGKLLGAAIAYARDHGATTLEAYPVDLQTGERIASANVYRGTLTMFERAGFTVAERRTGNASTPTRPIVRLAP